MSKITGTLTDKQTYSFPTISSISTRGKNMEWKIYVRVIDANDTFVDIQKKWLEDATSMPKNLKGWFKVDSGYTGGKIKTSEPTIITAGKNIGKINETNVLQQAISEARSKYNAQAKKASTTFTSFEGVQLVPPMLAEVYDQHPITSGYVQRKYNGIRCVSMYVNGKIAMYSRTRLIYQSPYLDEIKRELVKIFEQYDKVRTTRVFDGIKTADTILFIDGEVFNRDYALEDISGMVRTTTTNKKYDGKTLYYKIYDAFIDNEATFGQRLKLLDFIKSKLGGEKSKCHVAEVFQVSTKEEIDKYYKQFMKEGYEGAIVRADTPYVPSFNGYHTQNLLKLKPEFDGEFELIGYEVGEKGKNVGAVVLVCQTKEGEKFNVNPSLTIDERKSLAKKFATKRKTSRVLNGVKDATVFDLDYKGKMLIVKYEELSKKGVPLRLKTDMTFRDLETDAIYKVD